ncbi:MAG: hypothetical protein LBS92_01485 [Candidatus Methanoplasma sp.]|jgi:hypothetical protein|nr:hypothetical protein [Candidatus Methanoplasma sp.]
MPEEFGLRGLKGITATTRDRGSTLLTLNRKNVISTEAGKLVPQYTESDVRKKYNGSAAIYDSGSVKSISMEERSPVRTPLGMIEAELVTFYESGALKRVFPVNGKIGGFWTEADETALCPVLSMPLPCGTVTARFVNISFREDGGIRSVTLWPGETPEIDTPTGAMRIRIGASFHPNGRLRTTEPARPTDICTPIGTISAFDTDAVGVNADTGSLEFSCDGEVRRLRTVNSGVTACVGDKQHSFSPGVRPSLLSASGWEVAPLTVCFDDDGSVAFDGVRSEFRTGDARFRIWRHAVPMPVDISGMNGDGTDATEEQSCTAVAEQTAMPTRGRDPHSLVRL